MGFFVTGTDTEVGKTYVTALLIRALREGGVDAVGYKPLVCGGWEDVDALVAAAEGSGETRATTCAQYFDIPASPLTASRAEQRPVDFAPLRAGYQALRSRHDLVLVEGAGGWLVPLTVDKTIADLAADFALPVIVVVKNRLGAINHALLTLEHHEARAQPLGIVLNHLEPPTQPAQHSNRATFDLLPGVRVLAEITPGQTAVDITPFLPPLVR